MSRYIDADEAMNKVIWRMSGTGHQSKAIAALQSIPDADVAPVVHGRWNDLAGDYVTAECSVCGECYDVSDYKDKEHFELFKKLHNYCSKCGARMDGGEE